MSNRYNKLFTLAAEFEQISKTAKDKPKLDPKAKVRNRGIVCVPASSAKDKKDHFPINSEAQARNALAQVAKYNKVPAWYNGSLKSLQDLVSKKVHAKYKGIGKSEKKSSIEALMAKYGQSSNAFYNIITAYDTGSAVLKDFAAGMKMSADLFGRENNLDNPDDRRVYEILVKQAALLLKIMPEMEELDRELQEDYLDNTPQEAAPPSDIE